MIDNGDRDPHDKCKGLNKPFAPSKENLARVLLEKWLSLFGVKPTSKSSVPPVKIISSLEKGSCVIAILDELVDHSIDSMASTLVGKFIGQRSNIDIVRHTHRRNGTLKDRSM